MKKKAVPVTVAIVIALLALIILVISNIIEKNTPSKKQASEDDIYKLFRLYDGYTEDGDNYNFDNATRAGDNQVAIILQNKIVNTRAIVDSSRVYLNIKFIDSSINSRFYWDNNENILIFTTPTDIIKTEVGSCDYYVTKVKNTVEYPIVKTEGQEVYVAIDFVKLYSNIKYTYYEKPNRVVINNEWNIEQDTATLKSGEKVRIEKGIKSDILTSYSDDVKVNITSESGKWSKVVTSDGYVGFVQNSSLKNKTTETLVSDFVEPVYTNISKNKKINMAWHMVTNNTANSQLVDLVTNAKGLNVVSPTWFRLSDNEGNITSLADADYVTKAHLIGLDVWAMIDDQHSESDNKQIFTYTSKREKIINQLIATAIEYNLDGINIDFEYITQDIAADYIQFLRELSVKCRINGIVLSIDDKVPVESNLYYNRKEQGIIADYIIIMGYDEHWGEGSGSGSVASLPWVEQGISDTVADVDPAKVINAIPFYTRIWQEDMNGTYVDSRAVGMEEALNNLTQNGAASTWVDTFGQNYGEYTDGTYTYRIWLEDAKSIEEKMKLISKYNLAGVSAWRLGFENPDVWNTIIKYTN